MIVYDLYLFKYLVIFKIYCVFKCTNCENVNFAQQDKFWLDLEWTHLNYTWPSSYEYQKAVSLNKYLPENNAPTGIKTYQNTIFISVPRFRPGIPSTLNAIPKHPVKKYNVPLIPYPTWGANNDEDSCWNLQSVQSMEIDTRGIMWVLDGVRINGYGRCPTKLVKLDLNRNGKFVHIHVFPDHISLQNGGFLNDIVIDESIDGDDEFAYITDNSAIDPGLIVYSSRVGRAWKIRDSSMFSENRGGSFEVDGFNLGELDGPIDGIALSPIPKGNVKERNVYFTTLSGLNLYSISTSVLKDEALCKTGKWRRQVKAIGRKQGQTDGMMMDNEGNLFYTLMVKNGVGKWNINSKSFARSSTIDRNSQMKWPDGFALDQEGYLYLIANKVYKYINPSETLQVNGNVEFRIFKLFTGTKSYLYK